MKASLWNSIVYPVCLMIIFDTDFRCYSILKVLFVKIFKRDKFVCVRDVPLREKRSCTNAYGSFAHFWKCNVHQKYIYSISCLLSRWGKRVGKRNVVTSYVRSLNFHRRFYCKVSAELSFKSRVSVWNNSKEWEVSTKLMLFCLCRKVFCND